jgi:hypothetical protein
LENAISKINKGVENSGVRQYDGKPKRLLEELRATSGTQKAKGYHKKPAEYMGGLWWTRITIKSAAQQSQAVCFEGTLEGKRIHFMTPQENGRLALS